MKTVFVPLSIEEAQAMTKLSSVHDQTEHSTREQEIVDKLQAKIQQYMDQMKDVNEFFVRLSTRSPKDSKVAKDKREELMEELVSEDDEEYVQLNKSVEAMIQSLKVNDGEQAMALLLHSERIFDDLTTALSFPQDFIQQIVIREWKPIPISREFRAFVYDNSINALTQYFHYCYFPELKDIKAQLESRILKFHNSIKDKIPVDNYIIDFGFDEDDEEIFVIELNPFIFAAVEAGLFSWKEDFDKFKQGPYEFRIRTTVNA